MKCVICGRRTKDGATYCQQHQRQLDCQRAAERSRKRAKAFKYACYQGHVVGFFPSNGGKLKPGYVGMSLHGIPKGKLINLDDYCPGFTREQIKHIKAVILSLSGK